MNVFRIKINPGSGEDTDLAKTFGYCIENNVLGVGWGLDNGPDHITDWDEYERRFHYDRKQLQQPRYINDNVQKGDLVWTRGPNGSGKYESKYYLAQVTSGWEYLCPPKANVPPKIDIYNIFRCDILPIEDSSAVPGKVIRSWGGRGRSIQRVTNVDAYSKLLWNSKSDNTHYDEIDAENIGLFPLLDAWETEDVLALYLQYRGWRFVPNSANKGTTQKYEFLVTKPGGEFAWTQVKSGHTAIDFDWYKDSDKKVIVWQPNRCYKNDKPKHVECIDSEDVLQFIRTESANNWLPEWLTLKARLARVVT